MCWFSTVHIQSIFFFEWHIQSVFVVCFVSKTEESKANALDYALTFRASVVPGMPNSQLINGTVPFFLSRVVSICNSTFLFLSTAEIYTVPL
jgi:hypothetical protein